MSNTSSPEFLKHLCKNCTASWIDKYLSPRQTVNQVEACVMVAAAFLLILLVLGPMRRRSGSWIVQYGVMGAYMLSFPLLSYILGLMQGIAKNELYPVWCAFIVLLFGGANSVSVQQLDDNRKWLKLMVENALYLYYVGTISGNLVLVPGAGSYIRFGALVVLFVLVSIKNIERLTALVLASDARSSGSRTVFRYMKKLCLSEPAEYNPRTMKGYKYLVLPMQVDIADDSREINQNVKLITLEKIWSDSNGILSTEGPAMCHLKDVCLSFALFRLALRRYFRYGCAESGLTTTHNLVLQGLLLKTEEAREVERAFHVIEVELAFLYDFFFTKHATTMCRGEIRSFALSLSITVLTLGIGTYALVHPTNSDKFWDFGLVETKKQDIIVTKVIFCAIAIFLLVQYFLYCSSDWAKVSLVCKYITEQGNKCFTKVVLSLMGKFWFYLERHKWFRRRWQNKIGQYSFMDSFNHPCCGLEKFSEFIHKFRQGRKRGTSIGVPMEVKEAIARTLKDSDGLISNGVSSLSRHVAGVTAELDWPCQTNREFTLAHVILIWHIATGCCECSDQSVVGPKTEDNMKDIVVATSLSKYCAYLVAFAPHLLPGSPLETESTLDELVREARDTLKDLSEADIYTELAQLHGSNKLTEGGMLTKAADLGENLKTLTLEKRWELLADFWAEFMLYIAPSDNIAGHIESLAKGGEFVTHVWALLMHAGILERPSAAAAG